MTLKNRLAPFPLITWDGDLTHKENIGQCPSCGTDQPLLAPDDLRAHLGLDGEYCPGSRGAPIDERAG